MRTRRLGEIATYVNGRSFKPDQWSDLGVRIIRIENLNDVTASFHRFDGAIDPKHEVADGDLLVSWSASLDAYIWERGPAVLNQHIFKVSEDPSVVDRQFLYFALRAAMSEIRSRVHGATMRHITKGEFESVSVQVPPLEEQRQLAAQLTEQLAVLEAARNASSERRRAKDVLRRRIYADAFHGAVPLSVEPGRPTVKDGWSWRSLSDLARLESGHTPSRNRPDWWGGGIPWIALPDIRAVDGQVITQTLETTNQEGINHSSARILPSDTVVMSRTASVGFVARMGRPMATSQDFVNWVCGPDLDPTFLMHLLIRARTYIRDLSSGAIHKTVYVPTVKAFRVCVPSLANQRRIADNLSKGLATLDAVATATEAERIAIDALRTALLRRAFGRVAA